MFSFVSPRFALLSCIVACWTGLPVAAQTLPVDDDQDFISVFLETTNLRTGATASADELQSPSVDAVSSVLPMGLTGFSGNPGAARALSIKEGGIVRGSIHTGILEPYSANVESYWRQHYRKDADDATFDYLITDAYLALFHYGAAPDMTSTEISTSFDFEISLDGHKVFDQHAEMASQNAEANVLSTLHTDATGPMSDTSTLVLTALDGLGRPHEARLLFDPYGGSIDLSSIPVGGVFQVLYQLDLDASGSGGETEAVARFSDPADVGGGISTTITGLTAVSVPEPTSAWLIGVGLLTALGAARIQRRR